MVCAKSDIGVEEPYELANYCQSPINPAPARKFTRKNTGTPMMRLPCVAAKTGKMPGKGQSLIRPSAEFIN